MKKNVFNGNPPFPSGVLCVAVAMSFIPAHPVEAQIVGGNQNLIVNGNAESGPAGTGPSDVVTIPGWTRTGNATVLPYGLTGYVLTSDPAPPDHLFQYFKGDYHGQVSTLVQNIDVSSAASTINGGNVKYTAIAYMGSFSTGYGVPVKMTVDFKNANGQIFNTATLGPDLGYPGDGLSMQQVIGLVPAGTVTITVTLTLTNQGGVADSLSLVLSTLGTTPASVLGANLLVNGNAEAGPSNVVNGTSAPAAVYIPGWSTSGSSVCHYGGTGWIQLTDPGPPDRDTNLFCGYFASSSMRQAIDVSAAASLIDAGNINFQVEAWLGGISGTTSPTLNYYFFDWTGKQLAPTASLGPVNHSGAALVDESHSGPLPVGTREVIIQVGFPNADYLADDISFIIGNAGAPEITSGGVVPVFSTASTIAPGAWISIYGTGLASSTTSWNGNFPQMLGGTTVTIDSRPAYLWFVSPTQINVQVPDDNATGQVSVVVTTANGSFTTSVNMEPYAPSFSLLNAKYPVAIVPTSTPGNSGNGYDYIGPTNAFSFPTRPVKAGETIELFGVGFGPTDQAVPAGAPFSGAAPVPVLPTVTIGGVPAQVTFAGIIEAGLFQINVVVPAAGSGDQALVATIGGVTTQNNVVLTLQ